MLLPVADIDPVAGLRQALRHMDGRQGIIGILPSNLINDLTAHKSKVLKNNILHGLHVPYACPRIRSTLRTRDQAQSGRLRLERLYFARMAGTARAAIRLELFDGEITDYLRLPVA